MICKIALPEISPVIPLDKQDGEARSLHEEVLT